MLFSLIFFLVGCGDGIENKTLGKWNANYDLTYKTGSLGELEKGSIQEKFAKGKRNVLFNEVRVF